MCLTFFYEYNQAIAAAMPNALRCPAHSIEFHTFVSRGETIPLARERYVLVERVCTIED